MLRLVMVFVFTYSIFASTTSGAVFGSITFDRETIYRNAPVSGSVILEVDNETRLPNGIMAPFRFYGGALEVRVTSPIGATVTIDSRMLYGDMSILYAPDQEFVWYVTEKIRMPFFLLRTMDGFLFDQSGKYTITFVFPGIDKNLVVVGQIDVVTCEDCGEEAFVESYADRGNIVVPFSGYGAEEFDRNEGVYDDAFGITQAYLAGGRFMRGLFHNVDLKRAEPQIFGTDRFQDAIEIGAQSASIFGVNTAIWPYLESKYSAYKAKSYDFVEPRKDREGNVLVLPH